jgi:hypothetical protein
MNKTLRHITPVITALMLVPVGFALSGANPTRALAG